MRWCDSFPGTNLAAGEKSISFSLSYIQIAEAESDRARLFSQFSQNICKQEHEILAYSVNFYNINANIFEEVVSSKKKKRRSGLPTEARLTPT